MYVRWKRRAKTKRAIVGRRRKIVDGRPVIFKASDGRSYYESEPVRESRATGDYALSAQLVESRRIDGKPRQHVIAYLGTINESQIGDVGRRISFWKTTSAKFKALNLPLAQQQAAEQALHTRVPFPTQEEIQHYKEEMAALFARFRGKV